MTKERALLFDLGNVLIDFDHRIAVRRIQHHCRLSGSEIYNLFFDSAITDRYERGLIRSAQFVKEAKKLLRAAISDEEFVSIWNEIFTPNSRMRALLYSLKGRYSLSLVSNINELHFCYLKKNFSEYFSCFENIFLSYELHMRKPDKAVYVYISDFLKIQPHNIIYTDDRPELIAAAKEINFDAFVFESVDQCVREFENRGIIFDKALLCLQ